MRKPTFSIKKPINGRRTFAITKRTWDADGVPSNSTINDYVLDALNKRFLAEELGFQDALANVNRIKERLYNQDRDSLADEVILTRSNVLLLENYWKSRYRNRGLTDPSSMWNDLNRAIKAAGDIPLRTASEVELQQKIDLSVKDWRKHRRVVARLNQLLRYAKRDFRLRGMRKSYPEIKHLTLEQVTDLIASFPRESLEQIAVAAGFGTGCRIGELFSLDQSSAIKGARLLVHRQMDRSLRFRETKNRKRRRVFVLHEFEAYVDKWLRISQADKRRARNWRWSEIVRTATIQLWPDERERHITFHDLRHSYAIHLVRKQVSLTAVAQVLGDSMLVAQEHYAGYTATDETIDSIAATYSQTTL